MTFVIYLVMLFNLTIFKREIYGYSFNLIPFKTILYYLDYAFEAFAGYDFLGQFLLLYK